MEQENEPFLPEKDRQESLEVCEISVRYDSLSPLERSHRMSLIKGKNTKIEWKVRSVIHRLGYRYRLHYRRLPGKPDLAFPARKKAIFVHGCFWHLHDCGTYKFPKSHIDFWTRKLQSNVGRDKNTQEQLRQAGWEFIVLWECELKDPETLVKRIIAFLEE